jgi:hypothetical protein
LRWGIDDELEEKVEEEEEKDDDDDDNDSSSSSSNNNNNNNNELAILYLSVYITAVTTMSIIVEENISRLDKKKSKSFRLE